MKKIGYGALLMLIFILTVVTWDRGYQCWLKLYIIMLFLVAIGGVWLSNQPPNDGSGDLV